MKAAAKRCGWCDERFPLYIAYHDLEWGVPEEDELKLFEMLLLEGMQAGLSWLTILKKREGFRQAFDGFDYRRIALYGEKDRERLLNDEGIIRNRLKIDAAVKNARAFLELQKEFRRFSAYLWKWVDFSPLQNSYQSTADLPPSTSLSIRISKDLKKRGMNFVGPTIIYAFMQAVGMVNDHEVTCFRYGECRGLGLLFQDRKR